MEKIRVLVADSHPIFRQGIKGVLEREPDLEVVGEASDGKQASSLARSMAPDVVLLDIQMPSMNGLEVARTIKTHLPRTAVILMRLYDDEEQLFEAIKVSASAFFLKDVRPEELIDAIRRVDKRRVPDQRERPDATARGVARAQAVPRPQPDRAGRRADLRSALRRARSRCWTTSPAATATRRSPGR